VDLTQLHLGWIINTLRLDLVALSENLLAEIEANPSLEVVSRPFELPFDVDGNLPGLGQLSRKLPAA
jgi:hypothetical protein